MKIPENSRIVSSIAATLTERSTNEEGEIRSRRSESIISTLLNPTDSRLAPDTIVDDAVVIRVISSDHAFRFRVDQRQRTGAKRESVVLISERLNMQSGCISSEMNWYKPRRVSGPDRPRRSFLPRKLVLYPKYD